MARLRELIEKVEATPLTEEERQELRRVFVRLAQQEAALIEPESRANQGF